MARKAPAKGDWTSENGSVVRVFHPDANTYMDVRNAPDALQPWLDSGWEESPGEHIDADGFPAIYDLPGSEPEAPAPAETPTP